MAFERPPAPTKPPAWTSGAVPVFSLVHASAVYHASPDCLNMKTLRETNDVGIPVKYASSTAARAAGHYRPCSRCVGMIALNIKDDQYVGLTVEQLDTLRTVDRLVTQKRASVTQAAIASARGRHVSTAYFIVAALERKGLLVRKRVPGRRKASSGTIAPTELATVVLAKAVADGY